jgi:hypothetical protein
MPSKQALQIPQANSDMNSESLNEFPASELRVISRKAPITGALSLDVVGAFSDALEDILRAESRAAKSKRQM